MLCVGDDEADTTRVCQEVCDSEFNTEAPISCPSGTTCGFLDFFSFEIDGDVAICE
jgi:hypothetical protein